MKNIYSFLLLFTFTTLFCFTSLNAQWYEKTNGLPDGWGAYAIDSYDSLIAVGPYYQTSGFLTPDSFYITTDGGNNWNVMTLPDSLTYFDGPTDISIIGEDKIWFCTGGTQTDGGKIYYTPDKGLTWQLQFYDTLKTNFMNYIEMFDSLKGMAMGDAPANDKPALFLKTTNGGTDWISQNDSSLIGFKSGDVWRRVDFIDMNIGYFSASTSGSSRKLYKTINGGKDWELIGDTIACGVIKAYDENILLGEAGSTITGILDRTFNGGQTWERGRWDFMQWGSDIEYIPNKPSDIWLVSKSICFSSDTGRTWTAEFENEDKMFEDIIFINENYGWLFAANRGFNQEFFIYRTTNGGHGGIVSVEEERVIGMPVQYSLSPNFPNPFNPSTKIMYSVPQTSQVQIKVYDILGNEIAILINEEKPAGTYEITWYAEGLPSGIYFYRLQAGDFTETKKMILMK